MIILSNFDLSQSQCAMHEALSFSYALRFVEFQRLSVTNLDSKEAYMPSVRIFLEVALNFHTTSEMRDISVELSIISPRIREGITINRYQ